jgi:tetratricopeptide (TPR) repeat protein
MENEDLTRASKILNQTEVEISEIVSDYKKFISKQSKQINNNQSDQIVKSSSTQKDYINDGVESYREKNFSDAILNFTKALENNPDNTEILFFRALSKSEIGDRYGAINDYDKILLFEGKVAPINYKFSTVYNNKAYCLVELGFFDEALPLVEKALRLDETEWYIWDTRAEIYLNLGELDKCVSDCTKAISIEANGNSYLVRGLANIKKGEKAKGCQDLSKAGELGETIAYQKIKENCNKK